MKIDRNKVKIKLCNTSDVEELYNVQSIIVNEFDEKEKGYYLPFEKDILLRILSSPLTDGKIYAAFYEEKMMAWIFLSIHESIKDLLLHIPHIKGKSADIDGVMVLPNYRGNNLQIELLNYVFSVAKSDNVVNVLGEITYGNNYSLNNAYKVGFEKEGEYNKTNDIKRHILVKKL